MFILQDKSFYYSDLSCSIRGLSSNGTENLGKDLTCVIISVFLDISVV